MAKKLLLMLAIVCVFSALVVAQESATVSTTDSTIDSTVDITTDSATVSTSDSTTDSTTVGSTDSTSFSTTDSTIDATTDSTTVKTTEEPLNGVDCQSGYNFKCADCRNIGICAGGRSPVSTISCESRNPATPYCENDKCTSVLTPGSTCAAQFRCSCQGYFPNPNDCSKYYFCDAQNGIAHEYSCGPNRVYMSKEKQCASRIEASDCQIIDCSRAQNTFVRHGADLAYYAFCSDTGVKKETIVYKCEDDATSVFNLKTMACEFKCPSEGRHANPLDCTKFYECYTSENTLLAKTWSCPRGNRYNVVFNQCEVGTCE